MNRSSGILLHITSLPSPYGIGDLGAQAYRFVDWLASAQCKYWQTLPLGPTGYGDSPYQCFSAFAGNPYLISPDELIADGLLRPEEISPLRELPARKVNFGALIPLKWKALRAAFARYQSNPQALSHDFEFFRQSNAAWLDDFALFMALKDANGGGAWNGWDEALRARKPAALKKARADLAEDIERISFYQFLFFRQWQKLRAYANARGVQVIGDIPIFVAYDSADVWARPDLFFLDGQGNPTAVAGVPPDGFSPTGQLWGNPLYDWKAHKQEGYAWWVARIQSCLKIFDVLRLDHFRGFAGYYEISAGEKTAEHGKWVKGPGKSLFKAIQTQLGELPIIAEDLGVVTPDVGELLDAFKLPGMKVLQFGFSGPENPFLPHHYPLNCVAYTGTHDNDTARGWYESALENEKDFARRYLRVSGEDFAWDLIRAVWASSANLAVAPMQDVLRLGGEARMNYPSRLGGNWEWRMSEVDMREEDAARLRELNWMFAR